MAAQTRYNYFTHKGMAGGIVDLAPIAVDSFINESENGVLGFGMGVVDGTVPGKFVKAPESTSDKFEGIVTNRLTTERDLEGALSLRKQATVGVMKYGRIYVQLVHEAAPTYGAAVHMVCTGDDAGKFTTTGGMAINARFMGTNENDIAEIELLSAPVVTGA